MVKEEIRKEEKRKEIPERKGIQQQPTTRGRKLQLVVQSSAADRGYKRSFGPINCSTPHLGRASSLIELAILNDRCLPVLQMIMHGRSRKRTYVSVMVMAPNSPNSIVRTG